MSIPVRCQCGAAFSARPELAGKQMNCPQCKGQFTVPAGEPIRVACQCGQAFKAKPQLAGKQVRCPSCKQAIAIPAPTSAANSNAAQTPAPTNPLASKDDPLGIGNDPLGLGSDPLGAPTQNALGSQGVSPLAHVPSQAASKPRQTRAKAKMKFETDVLTSVTAFLCIIHGVGRVGLFSSLALIAPQFLMSIGGILAAASSLVSVGFLVAGVGLLTKQPWGMQVGKIVAFLYFALLLLSLLYSIGTLINMDNPSVLGGKFIVSMFTSIIAQSIVPGLLVYVTTREDD